MKKFVKIAAIVVAVILAVALIVPFALRGKIADIVKREANEMLAAKLDFEKLDISLLRHFPNASLDLKGLTLVGVDRFEGDTIVAAQRISVVVNLMSLFGDSGFEVTKVILSSPAVHAHKLADGAVKHGVSSADAYRMVSQMVAGTGKLQLATGQHPGVMKDAVCSPGGTTIVGVAELEHKGLRGAVIAAVDAVQNKPV